MQLQEGKHGSHNMKDLFFTTACESKDDWIATKTTRSVG
jgi:hypothetical protein